MRIATKPVFKRPLLLLFSGMIVYLSGCQTLFDRQDDVETAPAISTEDLLPGQNIPKAETPDENPILVREVVPERALGEEDQFRFPEREAVETLSPPVGEYPETLIKGIVDPDQKVNVTLNLDAAPLTEIVPLFGALLNFSYLIDPSVKGAVTMTVDSEMTAREAWQMFEHILWLAGAYASRNPGFIHVMPFNKMPQERRLLMKHEPLANVEVAFVPVLHTKSSELVNNIKPFMTDGATITDIPRLNTLLIVEAPSNMPKLRELISKLDSKGEANWPHIALRCHSVDAEVILDELTNLMPVLGFPVANQAPSGGQVKLTAIPRLQVIIASAAMKEVLNEVERWVRVLDKEDVGEQENIFFYNVRHSTAEQLSEALSVFFNTSATTSTRRAPTTKSTSSKAAPATGSQTASTPSRTVSRTTGESSSEMESIFDTPVIVYADTANNRLTLRTTPRAYAMVDALLTRLDVPSRQVMIQAVIAEITLNESTELGFSYAAAQRWGDYAIKHAVVNSAATEPRNIGDGFAFLFEKNEDKFAFLRAVAGETDVRVLSAPQILAVNDQEAIINVGDRVPIITGEYQPLDDSQTNTFRNVQYQDTGVILTVTPHITAGNEVKMDVKQEVSDAVETQISGIDSPTIQNRLFQTSLVIPDGGTIVLGGLIETTTERSHRGVPFLKDLPVVGWLFRTNNTRDDRTELIVLITANVIDRASTSELIARRYKAALEEIHKQLPR